ncbi:PAS domain-containing sensor histidine kinase [Tumebacillus permanentifrigoris]|uniref:PAS domain-containing sensor histidine kinase n=1 Tax=Tumebacillus permanentifrigoris TaxID=378543 RepID=UPI001474304F|nr:PAS domain-containing sensor histidine kinase [Tumebacillus permanentifrigoris]
MYSTSGWLRVCWLLLLVTGTISLVLDTKEFLHLMRGESAFQWETLTDWGFTALFVLSTLSLSSIMLRRKTQSLDPDALVQLITPLMNEGANGEPSRLPSSVYHLLQSLDVQRNTMRRCFQHAPFGVLFLGRNHSIVYANPVVVQMAGREAQELYSKQSDAFRSLFLQDEGQDDWLHMISQGQGALERCFGYLRQADGARLPVLVTGFPLTGTPQVDPAGFILFIEDISPSHQLRTLQHQHSFVLNSLHHGVVVTDLDFEITYANDALNEMFGLEPAQWVGQSIRQIVPADDGLSYRLAQMALENGETQFAQYDVSLPNGGGRRHVQVTATPLRDVTSTLMGMLLLYEDRSPEVELQETMRRNDQLETVSQMAASIAHEVRNPMTSVQGFLQLMAREIDPAHTHSMYLNVMEEDLKRINDIITEYLNFSRMGNDAMEEVRIATLLHNTYTLLQSEANLKGIEIELRLPGFDPLLTANANRLKQVLINLARNAMEAMCEGGGLLTLILEETAEGVCLHVQDTGPGITPDHLARIFNPFYTTKNTGTGLGLSISKKIIEEHNGTLQVATEPGKGTTFYIHLPR